MAHTTMNLACGITDLACKAAESVENSAKSWMHQTVEWFAKQALDQIAGAFTGQLGTISDAQFSAATVFAGKWIPVMAIATVLVAMLQIVRGAVSMNRSSIAKAVLGAALAVPATYVAINLAITATVGFDQFTAKIITMDPTKADWLFGTDDVGQAADIGYLLMAMILFALVWLASLVLTLVMFGRSLFVIALIGFSPVATMVIPWEVTRQWAIKWVQTLFALLIAKPLAAGIIVLGFEIGHQVGPGASSVNFAGAITGIALMGLGAFAPMAALKLVNFTGAGAANEAHGGAAEARGHVQSASQAIGQSGRKVGGAVGATRNAAQSIATRKTSTAAGAGAGGSAPVGPGTMPSGGSRGGGPSTTAAGGGGAAGGKAPTPHGRGSGAKKYTVPSKGTSAKQPASPSAAAGGGQRQGVPVGVRHTTANASPPPPPPPYRAGNATRRPPTGPTPSEPTKP